MYVLLKNRLYNDYKHRMSLNKVRQTFLSAAPNQVTDLIESGATTDSVTATWTKAEGVVDGYIVSCSEGFTPDYTEQESGDVSIYFVTCSGLPTAGNTYTITVTSRSGNQSGAPANLSITACELTPLLVCNGPKNFICIHHEQFSSKMPFFALI